MNAETASPEDQPVPARSRVRKDPEARRAEIVASARDIFATVGYAESGLADVAEGAHVSKGLVYHYFPDGKHELISAALAHAEGSVGQTLTTIFCKPVAIRQKIRALFSTTGKHLEASRFAKGCPVGAVTLDLDEKSEALRSVCRRVFDTWAGCIATGLYEVPITKRRSVALWILATLEGALVLARADGDLKSFRRNGDWLADALTLNFPPRLGAKSRAV